MCAISLQLQTSFSIQHFSIFKLKILFLCTNFCCRSSCWYSCCSTSPVTRWSRGFDAGIEMTICRWTRTRPRSTGSACGCAPSPLPLASVRHYCCRCQSPATRSSYSIRTATTCSGWTALSFKVNNFFFFLMLCTR